MHLVLIYVYCVRFICMRTGLQWLTFLSHSLFLSRYSTLFCQLFLFHPILSFALPLPLFSASLHLVHPLFAFYSILNLIVFVSFNSKAVVIYLSIKSNNNIRPNDTNTMTTEYYLRRKKRKIFAFKSKFRGNETKQSSNLYIRFLSSGIYQPLQFHSIPFRLVV